MTQVDPTIRVTSIHFDYATWHAHLAARERPSRLGFVPRRAANGTRPVPIGSNRILHLNLATWQKRLAGSTRAAA
jgi:hypothetical protein